MPTDTPDSDPEAPGWDAIDSACRRLYGDQEPRHWAPILSAMLGGEDPLQGISAYVCDEPRHWHFVTYGFSDLYDKESEDPEVSGFGFELTFRLARGEEAEPSPWCVNFLQNLARYVFSSGNTFEPGHHLDLNGPIALDSPTKVRAIVFIEDPQLGTIATHNGRVQFIQIVGITLDELQAIKRWHSAKFLELLTATIPLGVTDLSRDTLLSRPEIRKAVDEGCLKDGSSTGTLYVTVLSWQQPNEHASQGTPTTVTIGANGVRDLGPVLKGRIPHGEILVLSGSNAAVVFEPGERSGVEVRDSDGFTHLAISLTAQDALQLADLVQPKAGTYVLAGLPELRIVVERSEIKDGDGNVVEVIG
jgi:suppressor of fused